MQHPYSLCVCASLLWLTLLTSPAGAQAIPPATIDRLQQALRVSKPDTSRVALWLQLGAYHQSKPGAVQADVDAALAYAKKAEGLSRALGFAEGYQGSQLLSAQILLESNKMDRVQALLQKSKSGKPKIALLLLLGQHYLKKPRELQVDLDSAEGYVKQAIDLSAGVNDAAGQVEGLALLGNIYQEKGNSAQARVYIRQAIPILKQLEEKQLQDRTQAAGLWYQLGGAFRM